MHINFRLKREAEETIMYVNLKRTPSEEDREVWQQEIEDIKEQELRDNNAEVEAWKAEEEEEKIQVSKESKTREERVKFDLESSGTIANIQERVKYRGGKPKVVILDEATGEVEVIEAINRLAVKFATRGKEEPQNESRTVYSWERPYHQPGFRD